MVSKFVPIESITEVTLAATAKLMVKGAKWRCEIFQKSCEITQNAFFNLAKSCKLNAEMPINKG